MRKIKITCYKELEVYEECVLNEVDGMQDFIEFVTKVYDCDKYLVARAVVSFYRLKQYYVQQHGKITHKYSLIEE